MLTENEIRAAQPRDKEYKLKDGRGLFLLVTPNGGKWWRYRFTLQGRERLISVGGWPDIKAAAARVEHQKLRTQVALGVDPAAARKELRAEYRVDLESVCEEWLKSAYTAGGAKQQQIGARLRTYVYPGFGRRPIKQISSIDVVAILDYMRSRGRTYAAVKCQADLKRVWHWAMARGKVDKNIFDALRHLPSGHTARKYPGLTDPRHVGKLLRDNLEHLGGQPETLLYSNILPYVFTRPSELRKAEWREFDLSTATWYIPAERMKMDRPFVVPLATQVMALLEKLKMVSGDSKLLFPGILSREVPFSDATYNKRLKALGYTRTQHCGHGWRTTASTLLTENLGEDFHLIEMALSHRIGGIAGKYKEGSVIEARRGMMQRWADYLDRLRVNVVTSGDHERPASAAAMNSLMSDSSQRVA